MKYIRLRFAPSPTGHLHVGGLRTAVYDFLYAKSKRGKFILRIEDTDFSRNIAGAEKNIEETLINCGMLPDESPNIGGPFAPYKQSQRFEIYSNAIQQLLETDNAYKCFCSQDRLTSLKQKIKTYDNKCRKLSQEDVKFLEKNHGPYCIRFKLKNKSVEYKDLIHGKKKYEVKIGDPVIMKLNNIPTYHLANVVDDHLMQISHVLRGQEWLPFLSTHFLLYKAFGWQIPEFGHLPLLVNEDRTKLSKRHHETHVGELLKKGFTSDAIINYATSSNYGFEYRENDSFHTLPELVEMFRIDKLNTNLAHVEGNKLLDYNRQSLKHMFKITSSRNKMLYDLAHLVRCKFKDKVDVDLNDETFLYQVVEWSLDRIYCINDLLEPQFQYLWVFLESVTDVDLINIHEDAKKILTHFIAAINCDSCINFEEVLMQIQKEHNLKKALLYKILRYALCGLKIGPPIMEIMNLLGKSVVINRLKKFTSN